MANDPSPAVMLILDLQMEEALWHKFTQHSDLQAELLGTGDAELIEASPTIHPSIKHMFRISKLHLTPSSQDSDKDAFWGVGADRRGRNELGKALEKLRAKLRDCQ